MDVRSHSLATLAERIDRAVAAITRLKAENARLVARVADLEGSQAGHDALKAAERVWATERKEVAGRIDELVAKLDKLDA
ncbi:MAG: cell division protein ZapB [Candidatus Eisenbacteria bacterium]